jgi:hypothetical protein
VNAPTLGRWLAPVALAAVALAAVALAAALAAPLAAAAAPAAQEDPRTTTDVRCIVVAYSLTQSSDDDMKKIGLASLIYFWGRLQGREATAGIEQRIADEAARMTGADITAQANICGGMVSDAGQSLQHTGEAVRDRMAPTTPGR